MKRADRAIQSLMASKNGGRIPVIVTARKGHERRLADLMGRQGFKVQRYLKRANASVAWLTPAELVALEAKGHVERFSLDSVVRAAAVDLPTALDTSALRAAVAAPASVAGSNIGVAIVDSGIAPLPGLAERITAFFDFTGGFAIQRPPVDGYGHGTHVAGIVGGLLGDGISGVAPNVRLIGLRVLDNQGGGVTSNVIAALDFAVENKAALGIDVINLSLGHPIYESAATDPLVLAVERAVRAGIVVVASAGNIGRNPQTGVVGYGGVTSPGNAPSAITVGASSGGATVTRNDDHVTDFSSRGPTWFDGGAKPDVVAPGHGIVSALAPNSVLGNNTGLNVVKANGTYLRLSGTSMAAPVVSGVVALVLEASRAACPTASCPAISPKAVKAIVQYTATPLKDAAGVTYNTLVQGRGEVNASAAVSVAASIDTRMTMGEPWLTAPLAGVSTVDGETWAWSNGIVWGNRVLLGEGLLAQNELAWSDTIVWGTSMDLDTIVWGTSLDFDTIVWGTFDDTIVWGTWDGDTIVWGTSDDTIVWGTNVVWDDTIVWGTSIVWDDTIVWGTSMDPDTIVWGTFDFDTIVWGTADVSAFYTGLF